MAGKLGRGHLIRLRQLLTTHFDGGELRTLCFDSGVDYDDLPGEGKADKARELVAYLERHGRTPKLVSIGKRLRPDISWGDALKVTEEASLAQPPPPEQSQEKGVERQSGGVTISDVRGSSVVVGRDTVTHGDTITVGDVGAGAAVAAGRGALASVAQSMPQSSDLAVALAKWRAQMEVEIDDQPDLSADDRKDLKEQVVKIQAEAAKGQQTDLSRLERLITMLAVMESDVFEVVAATLTNLLARTGLVLSKVGDRVRIEREAIVP